MSRAESDAAWSSLFDAKMVTRPIVMDRRGFLRAAGPATAMGFAPKFGAASLTTAQRSPKDALTQRDFEILLPRHYTPQKQHTLIFCLHPNGRGGDYVRVLRQLAVESRCIIAASNKYRNGQEFAEFVPGVVRAVRLIEKNLSVAQDRIFLCGFSGGGMAAYVVCHQNPDLVAGVIVNNGSLHPSIMKQESERKTTIRRAALLSGTRDRVIPPEVMERDAGLLENTGTSTKIFTFRGAHTFAPVALYGQALEWLESD